MLILEKNNSMSNKYKMENKNKLKINGRKK
jgi:hypothetical protein